MWITQRNWCCNLVVVIHNYHSGFAFSWIFAATKGTSLHQRLCHYTQWFIHIFFSCAELLTKIRLSYNKYKWIVVYDFVHIHIFIRILCIFLFILFWCILYFQDALIFSTEQAGLLRINMLTLLCVSDCIFPCNCRIVTTTFIQLALHPCYSSIRFWSVYSVRIYPYLRY